MAIVRTPPRKQEQQAPPDDLDDLDDLDEAEDLGEKLEEKAEEIKKELYDCAQMVSALDDRMLQLNEEIREAKKNGDTK